MNLIRQLLLDVEGEAPKPNLDGYSVEQKVYHTALLIEARFIVGGVVENKDGYPVQTAAIRLTWDGHEFLDTARNNSIWNKAFDTIKKSGVEVSVSVLKDLLTSILKSSVGLPDK